MKTTRHVKTVRQTQRKTRFKLHKTWTWSASGYMFTGKSHPEIRDLCQAAGLSGIEGAPPLFEGKSDLQLEAIGAQYHADGLKIETFHLPFGSEDDLSSFYESQRKKAVDRVKIWIERSTLLGCSVGIQHASTSRYGVDVEGLDNYLRQLGKSLEALLPLAENLHYTLAIENLPPAGEGDRFMGRPEHFPRVQKEFGHRHLGFCLDTGHALISAGPERANEFYEAMVPRLVAYHLVDNAGDRDSHLAPGRGLVNWDKVFKGAAEIHFNRCLCIETPPFAQGPDYSQDAWRQMVKETDGLVSRALGV